MALTEKEKQEVRNNIKAIDEYRNKREMAKDRVTRSQFKQMAKKAVKGAKKYGFDFKDSGGRYFAQKDSSCSIDYDDLVAGGRSIHSRQYHFDRTDDTLPRKYANKLISVFNTCVKQYK